MTKPRIRVKASSRPHLTVVPMTWPADGEILRVLAQFEDRAKSGALKAIAVSGVNRDGSMSTAYVTGNEIIALMGATHHLLRRVSSEVATQ